MGVPVALLLTSGWWLPPALPSLAGVFDVQVESARRAGDGRLRVERLHWADAGGTRLSADGVELPMPLTYLWERFVTEFSQRSRVEVAEVALMVDASASDAPVGAGESDGDGGVPVDIFDQVRAVLGSASPWLPPVEVDRLEVRAGRGAVPWVARDLGWDAARLEGRVARRGRLPGVDVEAKVPPEGPWTAEFRLSEWGIVVSAELGPRDGDLWRLEATMRQGEESVRAEAEFAAGESYPAEAKLRTEGWTLPAEWLGAEAAEGFDGPVRIEGLRLTWDGAHYEGGARASGNLRAEGESVPLAARLAFGGDLERFELRRLSVEGAWLEADLDAPVAVDFADASVAAPARLRFSADLAGQAWIEARGRVDGRLAVRPAGDAGFELDFEIAASDPGYGGYEVERAVAEGSYRDGRLELSKVRVEPEGGEGAIEIQGAWNTGGELDLEYALETSEADWLNAWIGRPVLQGAQRVTGRIGGRLERPRVEAALDLGLEPEGMAPLRLTGEVAADGTERVSFDGDVRADRGGLGVRLDAELMERQVRVRLQELESRDAGRPVLALVAPTTLAFDWSDASLPPERRVRVEPFELRGEGLYLRGEWNGERGLRLEAENISSRRLDPWVTTELPEIELERLDLELNELRPWLDGHLDLRLRHEVADFGSMALSLAGRFGETGLEMDDLEFGFESETLLGGGLSVPLRLRLPAEGAADFWELEGSGRLEGALSGRASPAFSEWLERSTGVELSGARMDLKLSGTPEAPGGRLDLAVGSLDPRRLWPERELPVVRDIEVRAVADEARVELERFELNLNESLVSGTFALPSEALVDWLRRPEGEWTERLGRAEGELRLVDWKVEDWSEFLPPVWRRAGRVTGRLELSPGLAWTGELEFGGLALRPTASLPSVDGIGGRLEVNGREIRFDDGQARIGGSPVRFDGRLDASDWEAPVWEFAAKGENVPLVRTTDMILRSDLDLRLSREAGASDPLLAGELNLRSSTLLLEFDPLAPAVAGGPRRSPPYFSIEEDPFADWRFDVDIRGNEFLRVRNPYFRGRFSADFHLGGRFAQPLLIGELRTGESELRFPGAKMRIDGGEAYIEEGRSEEVQLAVTGVAKTGSYVVTMEVENTLSDPHVSFHSTPELANAQIVRLLATGGTSSGGAGTVGLYLGKGLLGAGGMNGGLSDKLTVDVGEDVSREGKNTVGIRYDLGGDTYLKGEYDVYDAYNLDLVWSLFKQ